MPDENFSIEVNSKFITNLFGLADMPAPAKADLENLNNVIKIIRKKIDNSGMPAGNLDFSNLKAGEEREYLKGGELEDGVIRPKSVLIVDDLGIITYQLELLFKKLGFDVTVSKEIYDAIEKYKTKDFGYAILDLFIPTEREGFILLDEIKKLALFCKLNTKIIMMSASSRTDYKDKCIGRGAECYIEKVTGWQKNIVDACTSQG